MFMRVYSISIKSSFFLSFFLHIRPKCFLNTIYSLFVFSFRFVVWQTSYFLISQIKVKEHACLEKLADWRLFKYIAPYYFSLLSSCTRLLRLYHFFFIFQLSYIAFFFPLYSLVHTHTHIHRLWSSYCLSNQCLCKRIPGKKRERKKKIYIYYSWFQKKTLK